jgi:hypothetical protein
MLREKYSRKISELQREKKTRLPKTRTMLK